jgi:hypothetical protein
MEAGPEHLNVEEPLRFLERLHSCEEGTRHVTHLGDAPLHFKNIQPIAKLGRLQLLEDLSGASYPRQDLLQLSG